MDHALVFGVLRVAGREVAVPAELLQEVVEWPATLVPPLRAVALSLGTFNLRGLAIPVLDLRRLLDAEPADGAGRIAVLRTEGGWLGLAVDGIAEVLRVAASDIDHLAVSGAASDPPLVTRLITQREGGRILPVLDVESLLRRPGVTRLAPHPSRLERAGKANRFHQQYLFFDCDDLRFCLETRAVREVIEHPKIDRTYRLGEIYHGMITLRGEAVPVVDLFHLLALPGQETPKTRLLVLELHGQVVALMVSAVVGMRRLAAENMMPLPGFGLRRPDLFSGVVTGDLGDKDTLMLREDALLLSHDGLMRDRNVGALHRLHDGLVADATGTPGARRRDRSGGQRTALLQFSAGTPHLVPLAQVQEILAMPPHYLKVGSTDGCVLGLMKRRGTMVPLADFRRLAGQPDRPADDATRVLLARGAQSTFGFIVDAAEAVEHAFVTSRADDGAATRLADGDPGETAVAAATGLLWVQDAGGARALSVVDLSRLACALEARFAPAA